MPAMPTSFASRSTGPPAADDLRRRDIRTCRRQHGYAAPRRSLPRCIQASLATLAEPSRRTPAADPFQGSVKACRGVLLVLEACWCRHRTVAQAMTSAVHRVGLWRFHKAAPTAMRLIRKE